MDPVWYSVNRCIDSKQYRRRIVTKRSITFPTVGVRDKCLLLSIFCRSIPPFGINLMSATLALSHVSSYLNSHNLYNTCQSAYRPGHSTETTLLKIVSNLFLSLCKGNISMLALIDFSSAFDTIDHPILVHRLHTDFPFTDAVLQWFSSYLTDRTHYVSLSNHCAVFAPVNSSVPHRSVLGLMLFTMHTKPLSANIASHCHAPFIC